MCFARVLAEVPQRLLEEVAVRLDRESRAPRRRPDAVVRPQLGGDLAQERRERDGLDARLLLRRRGRARA